MDIAVLWLHVTIVIYLLNVLHYRNIYNMNCTMILSKQPIHPL